MDRASNIRRIKAEAANPKPKKYYSIPKKSKKKLAKEAEEKKLRGDEDTLMEKWFKERRTEMTGRCVFCNSKTEKNSNERYKWSIAHLLPKRNNMFPSIATHKDNWLELCFYGESCHTNFDNGIISWELLQDSAEWPIIVSKLKSIYPCISDKDKKNIPDILIKCLDNGI